MNARLLAWICFTAITCGLAGFARGEPPAIVQNAAPNRPAAVDYSALTGPANPPAAVNLAAPQQAGLDSRMRGLMQQLGIQHAEQAGERGYLDQGAPAQDRARLSTNNLVHPPDAFHRGFTASPAVANDPNRLRGRGGTIARRGAGSGLYNFNQRVRPEGRFGYRYAIDHQEGDLLDLQSRPPDQFARRSAGTDMFPALTLPRPSTPFGRSTFGQGPIGAGVISSPATITPPASIGSPLGVHSFVSPLGAAGSSHLGGHHFGHR